jgi:hypothetical protein
MEAPLVRTLCRLVDFQMAMIDETSYAARVAFPPLAPRHVARLPEYLAIRHAEHVADLAATLNGSCVTGVAR